MMKLKYSICCGLDVHKNVKAIKGKKTDKKDSKWIADLESLGYDSSKSVKHNDN